MASEQYPQYPRSPEELSRGELSPKETFSLVVFGDESHTQASSAADLLRQGGLSGEIMRLGAELNSCLYRAAELDAKLRQLPADPENRHTKEQTMGGYIAVIKGLEFDKNCALAMRDLLEKVAVESEGDCSSYTTIIRTYAPTSSERYLKTAQSHADKLQEAFPELGQLGGLVAAIGYDKDGLEKPAYVFVPNAK